MYLKLKKQFRGETNLDVFVWDENNNVAFTGAYVNWLEKQCTIADVVKPKGTLCGICFKSFEEVAGKECEEKECVRNKD